MYSTMDFKPEAVGMTVEFDKGFHIMESFYEQTRLAVQIKLGANALANGSRIYLI